jgi:hypothetical protein
LGGITQDGFPHGVLVGLGLVFAFALSLLVLAAWGAFVLIIYLHPTTRYSRRVDYELRRGRAFVAANSIVATKKPITM